MGADLYIPKLYNPHKNACQPKFEAAVARRDAIRDKRDAAAEENRFLFEAEIAAAQEQVEAAYDALHAVGYFRDSYNATNVLNLMGLSYWHDIEYLPDDDPLRGDGDELRINVSAEACKRLLDRVMAAEMALPSAADLKKHHAQTDDDPDAENGINSWHRYFTEKRLRLIEFLQQAVDNGGMYASC